MENEHSPGGQSDAPETGPPNEQPVNDLTTSGRSWMKYSGMAFQMIVTILAFVFAGIYLDEWLGTGPWLTVVLSLAGVTAGLYVSLKDFL